MSFPTVIFEHFFHFWTFGQNFETHNQPTYIIVYSIRLRRVVEIFDQDQSLQTHAYWDYFHGKLVKLESVFSQLFYFQCHSENQYKSSACMLVSCGNWNFGSKCQTKKLVRKLPSVWMRHVSWIWPPFFHLILNLNLTWVKQKTLRSIGSMKPFLTSQSSNHKACDDKIWLNQIE